MTRALTIEQLDKLGYTIVYLIDKLGALNKTKLLKLLYLLEETSVKKRGLPYLNIPFEIWQFGPVSKDVYVETSGTPVLLSKYIETSREVGFGTCNEISISGIIEFNDDEFSDSDLALMDLVVNVYGKYNASQLVDFTHRESSPWYIQAKEYGLLDVFKSGQLTNTDLPIDFSKLVSDEKREIYSDHIEYLNNAPLIKT
jgi:uncharacterized phage-associated protein